MKLVMLLVFALVSSKTEAGRLKDLHKADGSGPKNEIKDLLKSMKGGKPGELHQNRNGNSLKVLSEAILDQGRTTVTRYNQHFQGVPVFGAHVIVAATEGKTQEQIDGKYAEGLSADVADLGKDAKTKSDKALQSVRKSLREKGKKGGDSAEGQCERIVYVDPESGKAEAAHQCTLDLQAEEISVPQIIVNDQGKVLLEWDLIQDAELGQGPGGNVKIGMYTYGPGAKGYFEVQQNGTMCSLVYKDAAGLIRVQTYDMLNSNSPAVSVYSFSCSVNDERDVNGGYSSLNDAHHHTVIVQKMFASTYKDIGLVPFSIKVYAHYNKNYDNAFWNGGSKTIYLGDGGSSFYPLVSLDVLAHEICHGVTSFNSRLVYANESGGINEAFSDMCGIAAEFFQDPSIIDWTIGEKCGKSTLYKNGLRCLNNPPACGNKKSIASLCVYNSTVDVHYSSGIFNKAFYNIATIPNVNIEIAFRMFYSANRFKWTPTSNFAVAAEGVLFYAEEWQSKYSYDIGAVVNAFKDVGISCTDSTPTAGGWDCVRSCP